MTLSFLSTLSSVVVSTQPSTTTKCSIHTGTIRCNRVETNIPEEGLFRRRDVLKLTVGTIGPGLLAGSGSFSGLASAADLIQRQQRSVFLTKIKDILYTTMKENPDLIPSLLTLALNDAMTYDKATKTGGANGSIRFSSEISRPENKPLAPALRLLDQVKDQIDEVSLGGPITYADLIQLSAQSALKRTFLDAAIRKCGGNEEKGSLLYTAYGSNGQWGLFERNFGRSDIDDPDPEGRIPIWEKASLAVMSAFLGPEQEATEALLAADPEVAPWVQNYQRSRETVSETNYEVDLITTLTKLSTLGQQINYEAYTYPVKRVDLTKLKL
ncbi:unnamed protein product [Rhodiola kirilowii]